jgi:hypothetical protein
MMPIKPAGKDAVNSEGGPIDERKTYFRKNRVIKICGCLR